MKNGLLEIEAEPQGGTEVTPFQSETNSEIQNIQRQARDDLRHILGLPSRIDSNLKEETP